MKTLSKKKLYGCISCKRNMTWKGLCVHCYNGSIGNNNDSVSSFNLVKNTIYKSAIKKYKPVPVKEFFQKHNLCILCTRQTCAGCAVITVDKFKVTFTPQKLKKEI